MTKANKGFTFVETILTVIIIGIIASVAAQVLISGLDIYSLIVNRNAAVQSARMTMDRMVDEIVLIETDDITSMDDVYFGFVDEDGISTNFRRTLGLVGGVFVLSIFRGSNFMLRDVSSLDFDYLKGDGTVATSASEVRMINMEITAQAQAPAGSIHLRTAVFPRNFMYADFQ